MGDYEALLSGGVESTVEYHPAGVLNLTLVCYESIKTNNLDEPVKHIHFVCVFFMVQKFYYRTKRAKWPSLTDISERVMITTTLL